MPGSENEGSGTSCAGAMRNRSIRGAEDFGGPQPQLDVSPGVGVKSFCCRPLNPGNFRLRRPTRDLSDPSCS